ncbi:MAG: glycerate kinase [Elusimicrobia bacterium]|nr:glycerate kinase [Elusimicrobiota bacterium]
MLIAPNAFKGSLTATQAARAMAVGVRRAGGAAVLLPLADGGDGTLDVLQNPLGLKMRRSRVMDPVGRPVTARWGYNPKTLWAVVEMARASGLALLKHHERNPLKTTSFGTGQLIRAAVRAGARKIFLGLGGSATVDGGLGLLQALGATVTIRKDGQTVYLDRPVTGEDLETLEEVKPSPVMRFMKGVQLRVLCDVRNSLLGPRGAARAFGPQKGATLKGVVRLERGLKRMAALVRSRRKDILTFPGTGAAGGAAAGLLGFTNARLERGTDTLFRLKGLEKQIQRADVVMTGEGRVDRTSWEGKALGELVRLCRQHKKPLIVLAGKIGPGGRRRGVRLVSLGTAAMSQAEKMIRAKSLITQACMKLLQQVTSYRHGVSRNPCRVILE